MPSTLRHLPLPKLAAVLGRRFLFVPQAQRRAEPAALVRSRTNSRAEPMHLAGVGCGCLPPFRHLPLPKLAAVLGRRFLFVPPGPAARRAGRACEVPHKLACGADACCGRRLRVPSTLPTPPAPKTCRRPRTAVSFCAPGSAERRAGRACEVPHKLACGAGAHCGGRLRVSSTLRHLPLPELAAVLGRRFLF